jgi:putative membrane protein
VSTATLSARLPLDIRRLPLVLGALWVLTMISIPIVRWVAGDGPLPWAVSVSVLLQAATVLGVLVQAWGVRPTLAAAATVVTLAWLVEFVGSTTGVPFGSYHYTNTLRPQLLGVPLPVPLAWLMLLPAAWAVADLLVGRAARLRFIAVAALAFTAWDLFLDPQMVGWGFWAWARPGGYFGIPWSNFLGWLLASALITAAVFQPAWRPPRTPTRPLLLVYTLTWLLQAVGLALFWAMPGPALAGFLAMGLFVALAWRAEVRP